MRSKHAPAMRLSGADSAPKSHDPLTRMGFKLRAVAVALPLAVALLGASPVLSGPCFVRGDADLSGRLEVSDAIRILGFLFLGSPSDLDCEDAADTNDDGTLNIGDGIQVLSFLFRGGPAPRHPYPDFGVDSSADPLGCNGDTGEPAVRCEQPPVPSFRMDRDAGPAPLEVRFDARDSVDADGTIEHFIWDFGDGGAGRGAVTSHVFGAAGLSGIRVFTVSLTVIDTEGASATVTRPVTVTPLLSTTWLSEYDPEGNYSPYYSGPEMVTPRYLHEGLLGREGIVYVFGGSDDRGLTAIDRVEFFDQSAFDAGAPLPESGIGLWIDTDFEGNQLVMPGGPRVLMTVSQLPDNRIVVIGGAADLFGAPVYASAEIFDPTTRTFEVLQDELVVPRFGHTAVRSPRGDLLIAGGQIEQEITVPEEGPLCPPVCLREVTVYPSTPAVEVFDPRENTFTELFAGFGTPSALSTAWGRAGHDMTRIAGPDNILGSADDMFLVVGGYQAVIPKAPGAPPWVTVSGVTSIEVFEPMTSVFTLITSFRLGATRVDSPEAVNLGEHNDFTPDGVRGMGNAILITGGNDNGDPPLAPLEDQVLVFAYAPGGGPAQGARVFEVEEDAFLSRSQNTEYRVGNPPPPGVLLGRSATNTVSLPRPIEGQGVVEQAIRVFSLAGVDTSTGEFNYTSPAMLAGCAFDPFFSLRAALQFGEDPVNLQAERLSNSQNFLGIVGVWFTLDGNLTESLGDFGTTRPSGWAVNRGGRRVFHKCFQLPGVDGIINTFDDRILITGGGRSYPFGDELTVPSTEIFIPPGASEE